MLDAYRRAGLDDAADIARLFQAARRSAMPWLPVLHSAEEDVAFFADKVIANGQVTLCEVGEEIVAFMATRRGWIDHLYVSPDHWRRGYGRRLVTFAQAMQDQLQLWTFQGNTRARAFYAAHGFEEAELTDGADNEERMPDVRLVWSAPARPLA